MAKAKTKVADLDLIENDEDTLDVLELDTNLDEYPEPELLPPGSYNAEVQKVQRRTNQSGTAEYYSVTFIIAPGNFPADYDVDNWPDGIALYYNLLRVPTSGDRRAVTNIRRFIERLGLPTDTPAINPNEWVGRPVLLKVEHNTYEGVRREQIARNGIQSAD